MACHFSRLQMHFPFLAPMDRKLIVFIIFVISFFTAPYFILHYMEDELLDFSNLQEYFFLGYPIVCTLLGSTIFLCQMKACQRLRHDIIRELYINRQLLRQTDVLAVYEEIQGGGGEHTEITLSDQLESLDHLTKIEKPEAERSVSPTQQQPSRNVHTLPRKTMKAKPNKRSTIIR